MKIIYVTCNPMWGNFWKTSKNQNPSNCKISHTFVGFKWKYCNLMSCYPHVLFCHRLFIWFASKFLATLYQTNWPNFAMVYALIDHTNDTIKCPKLWSEVSCQMAHSSTWVLSILCHLCGLLTCRPWKDMVNLLFISNIAPCFFFVGGMMLYCFAWCIDEMSSKVLFSVRLLELQARTNLMLSQVWEPLPQLTTTRRV